MSFFDKVVNSKLNAVADWIIRLIMINIMIIFFSLPVVTLYPALSAGYNLLHDYSQQKDTKLFKGFWKYFKIGIGKKIIVEIVLLIVFLLGYSNIRYYTSIIEGNNLFFLIGYYVSLALLAMVYGVSLYTLVVVKVNPKMRLLHIFKISFMLAGKFYFITMLLVIVNSIPFLLLFHPITMLIFVFMGITIPLLLHVLLTKNAVFYLEGLGDKNA